MKALRLAFSPEAERQILSLYRYIANQASPAIAQRFTDAIVGRCEGLTQFPLVGRLRQDIRPNLRVLPYRRRVMIAYSVNSDLVAILGIFYGGQDFETLLREDEDGAD